VKTFNEAPRSKLRGIEAEFAEANPPSHKASAGHLAIPPCSKLQGILAKANERCLRIFKTVEENTAYVCGELNINPSHKKIRAAAKIRADDTTPSFIVKNGPTHTLTSIRHLGLKTGLTSDCFPGVSKIWDGTPFSFCLKSIWRAFQ